MAHLGRHTFLLSLLLLSIALANGHSHEAPSTSIHTSGSPWGLRFLVGEDCMCNGTEVHCTGDTSEDLCSCHEDGDLECVGDTCHCDGDDVHCVDESEESLCSCADGVISCEASSSTHEDHKDWGKMILFTLVVNLMTLAGVVILGGEFLRKIICPSWEVDSKARYQWTHNYIPMFACGALLATVVFLILPEAYLQIAESLADAEDEDHDHDHRFLEEEEDHEEETESPAAWRWGTSVLCGFLIPYIAHCFLPGAKHDHDEEVQHYMEVANKQGTVFNTAKATPASSSKPSKTEGAAEEDVEEATSKNVDQEGKGSASGTTATEDDSTSGAPAVDWSLFLALSLGDFFHNFADGIFIGTSFLLCDTSVAFTVVAATVAHELPQEIADFFLLVNQCHMSPLFALAMNFLVGMSVMLGGVVVFLIPDISPAAIGIILAMGGGVYLHVAICECFTRAERAQQSLMDKVYGFLGFVIGAIPIGLVLINHEHCHAHDE